MEGLQCLERRIYERPLTSEPFIENQSEHISKLSLHQSLVKRKFITKRYRRAREPSRISLRFLRRLKNKSSVASNLISEVGVNLFCQFCVIMDVKYSFSSLVGGSCSYDPRDRSRSTEVIPFLNCKRDIAGHKSSLSITDVETEIELILGRVSTSFSSELDLSELTICPRHCSSLGIAASLC